MSEIAGRKTDVEPCRILAVEFEPTHYKTDLWNVVATSGLLDVFAIYTQAKNWSPDGGHNYLRFPEAKYRHDVLAGRGLLGSLRSAIRVTRSIFSRKPDVVLICGYSHLPTIFALLSCFVSRRRFLLFVDEFNNKRPPGRFRLLKWFVRESLRKFCFKYSDAVLTCGREGRDSAVIAGCAADKVYDFPYVVDVERILADAPEEIPAQCLADRDASVPVIFFSGRMIERKGLPSLLEALTGAGIGKDWILWIEGAGPELQRHVDLAREYGIADRCRFLGFCQYDLHSWLIRSADIVIVPSLEDNWGIVVDEGLQLGKTVISSDATGSGKDRITDGQNGYIFPAGNSEAMADLLRPLINDGKKDLVLEEAARSGPRYVTPADNLNTLLKIIRCN